MLVDAEYYVMQKWINPLGLHIAVPFEIKGTVELGRGSTSLEMPAENIMQRRIEARSVHVAVYLCVPGGIKQLVPQLPFLGVYEDSPPQNEIPALRSHIDG